MSNKVKVILILILTVIMAVAIKFGAVNEDYLVDTNLEKLYTKVEETVALAETYSESHTVELQEKINKGREVIVELQDYLKDKPKVKVEEVVPKWSVRLDALQQLILTPIQEAVIKAQEEPTEENINKIRETMPSNLPEEWRNHYEEVIKTFNIN